MRRMFGPPNYLAGPRAARRPARRRSSPVDVAPAAPFVPAEGPVVLVLPARDEAAMVATVVRAAPASIAGRPVVVVVVDDGSVDGTAAAAASAGAEVVALHPGRGLGAAVRAGLQHATLVHRAAVVAFCDADGEYSPEDLPDLVAPVLAGRSHYVVGSRFRGHIESMQRRRRLGNRVLTVLVRRLTGVALTDGQSGFRALSGVAAARAEIIHDYNYAQVLTLDLLAKGSGYCEVPIRYRFRTTGTSFIRLPTYLRRVLPALRRELALPSIPIHDSAPRTERTLEATR